MAWTFKATSLKAALKPGLYRGSLTEIEARSGSNGEYLLWKFAVDHEEREVTVTEASSKKFGPKAKARLFAEALLGKQIKMGEEISPEELYGRSCQLLVTVVPLEDNGQSSGKSSTHAARVRQRR